MSGCVVMSLPQGTIAEQPLKEALQREGITLDGQNWLHTSGSAAFPYAWFFCDDAPAVASLLRNAGSCGADVEVTALERAPPPPGLARTEPAAGRARRLESAVEPVPPPAPPLPPPAPSREDFGAASAPALFPQAVSWKAGDWYCSCQKHNFAFRTECGRCRTPRSPLKRARDASWPEEPRPRSPPPPPPRGVLPPATCAAAFLDALQSVPAAASAPAGWAEHFPPPPPPPQPVGVPSHYPEWASLFLNELNRPAELHPPRRRRRRRRSSSPRCPSGPAGCAKGVTGCAKCS